MKKKKTVLGYLFILFCMTHVYEYIRIQFDRKQNEQINKKKNNFLFSIFGACYLFHLN